jgi:hypothetical protein
MDVFGNTQAKLTTTVVELYSVPVRAAVDVTYSGGTVEDVTASVEADNTQSQITSIIIAEVAGGLSDYSLWVTPWGNPNPVTTPIASDATSIASLIPLLAQEVHILSHGLVLAPGMSIWGSASGNAELVITINHIEVS